VNRFEESDSFGELTPDERRAFRERHVAIRVVVPPCENCGAGADEPCAVDCPKPVDFQP